MKIPPVCSIAHGVFSRLMIVMGALSQMSLVPFLGRSPGCYKKIRYTSLRKKGSKYHSSVTSPSVPASRFLS